ncbi:double-strand break repair protein MRE11-like isoform X2 [Watersipora subatra]
MMNSVIELLRKYTTGQKPCQIEFLSDPSINFGHSKFPIVNYEDPNINISYPVFSVHGNHDDPSRGNLSALDILSSTGLVNYFGKCNSLEQVEISPLLLRKGETKLALYGLGCIRDERLHRLFEQRKVKMLQPREQSESWFNIFAIHQNRARHSAKDYIPENFLGEFLDFVLWGHEHECRVDPEYNGHYWVSQPGSSVATSLSEGESKHKHCALLKVHKKNFSLQKIRLQTVRPFYFEDVNLASTEIRPEAFHEKKVLKYCAERVEALIRLSQEEHTGHRNQPKLPLIRLRVDHTGGYEPFHAVQFGQQFVGRVANPKDTVLFTKKRQQKVKGDILNLDDVEAYVSEQSHETIEELVNGYLGAAQTKGALKLEALSERGMGKAVGEYVKRDDKDAILVMVDRQVELLNKSINEKELERDADIVDTIRKVRAARNAKPQEETDLEFDRVLEESQRFKSYVPQEELDSDCDIPRPARKVKSTSVSSRGRGGRGSRSRGGSTRGRGRGKGGQTAAFADMTNSDSDDITVVSATPPLVVKQPPVKRTAKGILVDSDGDDDEDFLPGKKSYRRH